MFVTVEITERPVPVQTLTQSQTYWINSIIKKYYYFKSSLVEMYLIVEEKL